MLIGNDGRKMGMLQEGIKKRLGTALARNKKNGQEKIPAPLGLTPLDSSGKVVGRSLDHYIFFIIF
jgi:hypothetical protein